MILQAKGENMDVRAEIVQKDLKFWNDLSYSLDIERIRIIEIIYDHGVLSFDSLIKFLSRKYSINLTKRVVRKILGKIKEKGLIQIIPTHPLQINSVIGIEDDLKKLLILSKSRLRLN